MTRDEFVTLAGLHGVKLMHDTWRPTGERCCTFGDHPMYAIIFGEKRTRARKFLPNSVKPKRTSLATALRALQDEKNTSGGS